MLKPPEVPIPQPNELRNRIKAVVSGGLTVLSLRSLVHAFTSDSQLEGPKKVLLRSRWHAIAHSLVHLVPVGVFTVLIYLNYNGFFYGIYLSTLGSHDTLYLALYQVAAKGIELASVTSLGIILLHVLRSDLIFESLVPLGLLTSPLWFTTPVSLFSPEFLTTVQITMTRWWRVLRNPKHALHQTSTNPTALWKSSRITLLVLVFILLAAFIGPASAVLLIPRIQNFPAGAVTYNMNATHDEMWPTSISSTDELEVCIGSNATSYPVCPSGGYQSLRLQGNYNRLYGTGLYDPSLYALVDFWPVTQLTIDPTGILPPVLASGFSGAGDGSQAVMLQPNLYTTIQQSQLVRDWREAIDLIYPSIQNRPTSSFLANVKNFHWVQISEASGSSLHPITSVRCSAPRNLSREAETVGFSFLEDSAVLPDLGRQWSRDAVTKPVVISKLNREPTSHVRTQWIALPTRDFGLVSTGLLIEMPWTLSMNNSSRLAIPCTIAAAWSLGTVTNTPLSNQGAWVVNLPRIPPIVDGASMKDVLNGKFSRRIELERSWLNLLTPIAPDPVSTSNSWQPNTLENILSVAGFDTLFQELRYGSTQIDQGGKYCQFGAYPANSSDEQLFYKPVCGIDDRMAYIQRTVARLVSDGLSRRMSYRAFDLVPNPRSWRPEGRTNHRTADYYLKLIQGSPDPSQNAFAPPEDTTRVSQRMIFKVNGYAYRASETSDYVATLVVAIYLFVAACHLLSMILMRPVISTSWNSALELVLLAFNSTPDPALRGTSAGIHCWRTYQHLVRVRATTDQYNIKGTSDTNMADSSAALASHQDLHVCLVIEAETPISDIQAYETGNDTKTPLIPCQSNDDPTSTTQSTSQILSVGIATDSAGDKVRPEATRLRKHQYLDIEVDKKYM